MVAYSFQKQFVEPILAGRKTQTIRAERTGPSRHARVGEEIQLYFGLRTQHAKLIAKRICTGVAPILLELDAGRVEIAGRAIAAGDKAALDAFARLDGFECWDALRAFWAATHPGIERFVGVRIGWGA